MANWIEMSSRLARKISGLRFRWNAVVGVANVLGKRGGVGCDCISAATAKKFVTARGGP